MDYGISSRGGIGRSNVLLIPPVLCVGGAAGFFADGAVAKYSLYRRAGEFIMNGEAEAGAVKGGVRPGGHHWKMMKVRMRVILKARCYAEILARKRQK